ncbi:MAG: helix-turn-helix domain-containing protein [Planctomycetota bacterium]
MLKHRRRKLEADPADTLGSAVPGGVEAVMLTDSLGTVLASDAGAGRLMGSSPVGQTLADALPNLRADALVRRAANQTLVSPPFEQPGGLGPAGTPLELNIVPLLSDGQFPKLKLALVAQKPMTRGCGSLLAGQPSWGIARHGGLKQAGSLAYGLGSFLGRSPLVESLRESARQASFGREPVLIIAPSGAGARSLAKAMHFTASPLAPLEQLEAGNLPGRWILDAIAAAQSRGASGQERSYLIAHVNRLSHADQAALVDLASFGRLLLTSSEPPQALHPRLAAAVADRFLVLPTLREHLEDLPLLASHFVQQMHPMARIAPEAVEALMRYPWPGNATELENCLRQAYLAACPAGNGPQAALIERHHLPPGILHYRYPGAPSPSLPIGERKEWEISEEDPVSFDLYERKVILRALDHCKGNRLACARLLRLGKSTLYRKLKRLGIDVEE